MGVLGMGVFGVGMLGIIRFVVCLYTIPFFLCECPFSSDGSGLVAGPEAWCCLVARGRCLVRLKAEELGQVL